MRLRERSATWRAALAAIVVIILYGCGGLWLDTHWRSGKYVAIAVDDPGQMALSFDTGDGMAFGVVGPTVFSIGADDKYIVAKQHPATDAFGAFDRSVTNYFVVERIDDFRASDAQRGITGPLTQDEFDQLASKLHLPSFTKTFGDLE